MVRKGSVRDSVKRVLLIEGTPDSLYHKSERIFTSVEINGKTFHLGSVSEDFVEELKKVNGFEVMQRVSERTYPNPIRLYGIGQRTIVRKVNNNTHIIIGAKDEVELNDRVEKIKSYLEKKGAKITERCHWVCSVDKKEEIKKEIPVLSITIEAPVIKNEDVVPIKSSVIELNTPKSMSEKTKILREIGMKAIKKKEAVIKMGLAAIYE